MGFDIVIILHVLAVVGALAGTAADGLSFALARRHPDGRAARQYFGPGPSPAPRLVYAAALLGVVAAALHHRTVDVTAEWVWVPTLLGAAAAAVIELVGRPAAATVHRAVRGEGVPDDNGVATACRHGAIAAGAVLTLLLASGAIMTVKP